MTFISTAIDKASEIVGKDWTRLAGKFGFCKTDIDSIVHNHPCCLRSQIDEFFTTWRSKNRGRDPRELCAKLRAQLQELGLLPSGCERMEIGAAAGCSSEGRVQRDDRVQSDDGVESDGPVKSARASPSTSKAAQGTKSVHEPVSPVAKGLNVSQGSPPSQWSPSSVAPCFSPSSQTVCDTDAHVCYVFL